MLYRVYHLLNPKSLRGRLRVGFIFLIVLFFILCYIAFYLYVNEFHEIEANNNIQYLIMLYTGVLAIILLLGLYIILFLKRVEHVFYQVLEGVHQIGRAKYSYRIEPSSYADYPQELQEICTTFNKMTETIQYQMRSIQKSEERYRMLVETSPNAIVVHQDGKIVYVNPRFTDLVKAASKADLLGQHIIQYVHPDYHEIVKQRIQQLENNQPVELIEEKYVLLDGSIVDVEVIATPVEYMGKPAFQVIMNNTSKRKEILEELKASEERFRLLAEYSSDMITLHDVSGKYLYASPACKETLQYDEEDVVGQDAYLFLHPDDIELAKKNHQILLDNGYTVSTYRIRRKDGEYVWFESAIRLLDEMHSDEVKLIVVSRNISERKLVEQRLQEANNLLQHLSTIDGLTGIANRRAFDERFEMEWNRSYRSSSYLSLIILDIDYFKVYNDTYGHQGGDNCLKQVASAIQDTLRQSTDFFCRYGGEEFCVILPETNEEGARKVGEKIRMAIELQKIPHIGSKILPWVTISVGTATMIPTTHISYMNLFSNADKALYQAKYNGRNCVHSYKGFN